MRKLALFILSFMIFSVIFTKEVVASTSPQPLSKAELLEGIQNWRRVLKNIPGTDLRENDLQQEFLFRLQFLSERRYEGSDASLIRLLDFMKELEDRPSNMSSSALSPFLEILLKSIKEVREAQEPLWPYIQQFMVDNSLKNPVAFEDTVKQRDYINQFETQSARVMSQEEINQYFISMELPIPVLAPAVSLQPVASDSANVGKLEEGPRTELPPETRAANAPEGKPDVGAVEVIQGEQPAVKP